MNFEAASALFTKAFPNPQEPGACLMIARHGELLHLEASGLANLQTGTPISDGANFRLASITKQFTASAILLLRQEGKLDLQDPIGKFFPRFPEYGADSVTVHNLLQHTSGLLDYEDFVQGRTEPVLDEDVLDITMQHDHTYFQPGTQFRYSNTGYALLACIVQQLTELSFPEALEKLIFKPTGMEDTLVLHKLRRPAVPNRALGYRRLEDGTITEADQNLTSAVLGDGGVYCSARDYLKWDKALWSGALLPAQVVREMISPGVLEPAPIEEIAEGDQVWFPEDMNESAPEMNVCILSGGVEETGDTGCTIPYGLGWRLETNSQGHQVAYHPGSTTGFNHCVRHLPALGLTTLVLANRTSAGSKELARSIEIAVIEAGGF